MFQSWIKAMARRSTASSAPHLRRRLARSTASAALVIALVVFPGIAAALGPTTNSLRLLTLYDVDWVDPQTGRFGMNITFFRPADEPPQAGWTAVLAFRSRNLVVETYSNPLQFALDADRNGNLRARCVQESPAVTTASLAASDKENGFRRMAIFVNGMVQAPAALPDLTPTSISLINPGPSPTPSPAPPPVALVDQRDFEITQLRQNLPTRPFGPFLGATTAEEAQEAEAVPSPNGTDLLATTGLYITCVIFVIAATAFSVGVVDKWNSVRVFEAQRGKSRTM